MTRWQQFAAGVGMPQAEYEQLWRWSVDDLPEFWRAVWRFFDVQSRSGNVQTADALADATMPGARWFDGIGLNCVDQVLRHTDRPGAAIVGVDESGSRREVSWRELPGQVGAVAAALRSSGVGRGDVVAGYLPDIPEAMVAFLATAALGAIWSGCGQDYAPDGAAARLGQLAPTVVFSAAGYTYRGRWIDKRADTAALVDLLPGAPSLITTGDTAWQELVSTPATPSVEAVPFDHPLWVVFSSGTTGRPKGIVHGHGGVLLEHLKAVGLHAGLEAGDVFFWQTALSWMMWNFRAAGLLVGSTVVCYSGDPLYPDANRLWDLVGRESVTYFGTSPGLLLAARKAGVVPDRHDLHPLRVLGITGSPLPGELFTWATDQLGEEVEVSSVSGGTDVVTAFAGGTRGVLAAPGELSTRYLGVDLHSWAPDGRELVGKVGELVIGKPMPSMPVGFWHDDDGSRYRAAYFDHEWNDGVHPHTWRHGDWVTLTERGSLIIHGRSDATLNRHGIRMGSADIYEVVEAVGDVREAFVLGIDGPDGAYWMPLFVTLTAGKRLDAELQDVIRQSIRAKLSPRHLPDEIIEAPGIPHTRTGKKLEVPVSAVLAGHAEVNVDPRAIDEPSLIDWYREQGRTHRW